MASALVTGGAGFIGSHLVESLLAGGWQVKALDDFSTGRVENLAGVVGRSDLEVVRGDILDAKVLMKAMKDVDVVFHEAAVVSQAMSVEEPLKVNRVNVEGTLTVLEASRKAQVERFVYASSCSIYGEAKELPTGEDAPLAPLDPYAASKAACEHYCLAFQKTYGLKAVSLRYSNVYGPRCASGPYEGVMASFAKRLLSNQPPIVFGDGDQTRDFVHVTDVAEATGRAAKSPNAAGRAINVATGVATSINHLAQVMAEITGKAYLKPARADPRPGEIMHSQADTSLAKELLGYQCKTPLCRGIRDFLAWYKRNAL